MTGRRLAAAGAFVLARARATPAPAVEPIYTNWRGLALSGYDPVAYFTDGKAVPGSSEFTFEWMNARWRFASAAHRDAFRADPSFTSRHATEFTSIDAEISWIDSHDDVARMQ